MTQPAPRYRVAYTKQLPPSKDGRPGARVHCEKDDEEADQCTIEVARQEFTFGRSRFDPGRWDPARDTLEHALLVVFEQGRAEQRQIMRDALGLKNEWGGDLHGRSGT